jgi:hypothetical protein
MILRFFSILFISILLVSLVSAQLEDVKDTITDTTNNLNNNITKAKEFTDKDKWDFIGSQWKEILLKNKAISAVDGKFTQVNVVFVVLFARDYSLSLEMLFVFMLWLFTLLILPKFVKLLRLPLIFSPKFFENGRARFLFSLGGVIILAHARLFAPISDAATKAVLYKSSFWWRLVTFATIFIGLFLYLKLSGLIAQSLLKAQEKKEKEELKEKVEKVEKFQKTVVETVYKVESDSA